MHAQRCLAVLLLGLMLSDSSPLVLRAADVAPSACTSFCLDNGDHCIFGANQDNLIDGGLLFVNPRDVLKTAWEPSTDGTYARWVSRYGSVSVVHGGYQMAWAGMNEAGLMVSTMALRETQNPEPDNRPPLVSSLWLQYQLDMHATVQDIIASDTWVRISDTVDHYLVCDRTGDCAVIEFLGGQMTPHTGDSLPVKALANSPYVASVQAWQTGRARNSSLDRFVRAAGRLESYQPADIDAAVEYAFGTLAEVALDINAWRFVFDPINLQVHFRTNRNPQRRTVTFRRLDFACGLPVRMLDVHTPLSGDISGDLVPYSHAASLQHTLSFLEQYERLEYPPFEVELLLRGMESFPCRKSDLSAQTGPQAYLEQGQPILPPRVTWGIRAALFQGWPAWLALVGMSLAFATWRLARSSTKAWWTWLAWLAVVALLGPLGALIFVLASRQGQQVAAEEWRKDPPEGAATDRPQDWWWEDHIRSQRSRSLGNPVLKREEEHDR